MTSSSEELDRQGPPSVLVVSGNKPGTTACWPVNWSGVIVGALTAAGIVSIFGLIAIALGAHEIGSDSRVVDIKKIGIGALILSLFGAFLSFVAGGWVAAKIANIRSSENAMLHGAIVWLVAVPMLFVFSTLGAGSLAGGWFAGLDGSRNADAAPFERPELVINATPQERDAYRADLAAHHQKVAQWRQDTPKVVRNTALGAITALLLGLVGGVLGGWLASGEPMTFTYYRTRPALT